MLQQHFLYYLQPLPTHSGKRVREINPPGPDPTKKSKVHVVKRN